MIRVFIFLICITDIFAGKCSLRLEETHPGIFWRDLGSNHVLLEIANNGIAWDDRYTVIGYCPNKFHVSTYNYGQRHEAVNILLSCSGNTVYVQNLGTSTRMQLSNGFVSCTRTAQYYEASIPACNDYELAYGFFIENIPIVLAGACYDLKSMQSRFLHYIAGPQSSVVEYRVALNSVNVTSDALSVDMDCITIQEENKILAQAVEKAFPKYNDFLQFKVDDLISFRRSQTVADAYFDDLNCVNMIPWWLSLKNGNWKTVEEIVTNLARHDTYDVYTGTSGILTYPTDDKCSTNYELTYDVNNNVRQVPLYVWKYIKGRTNDTDKGVVIVGINSPFVHHSHRSEKICSDMCEELSWMHQLQKTRKFAALGYVFCCHPGEVEAKLDNFPIFVSHIVVAESPIHSSKTSNSDIDYY